MKISKGFTIIEVLIVIAILGILVSIFVGEVYLEPKTTEEEVIQYESSD